MQGRLAFTDSRPPSTVDGKRIKSGYSARGIHFDNSKGVIWYAHIKAEWRTPIITASGMRLKPFLTDDERERAEAEFAVIGWG